MKSLGDLLKAARAGDPESIEALVRSQLDRLYGVAFRVTGDGHLAEDVVQEVFLRVLRGRSTCRNPDAAPTWLTKITVRMALDQMRERTARRRREESYAAARETPGEGQMEANDLEILNEALASLSADGRACLWLHFAEGLNVREVAEHIGKGKSATANRIREAADHLRTFLTKRGFALGMAAPLPDLLRGLPRPVSPPGLSEKVLKAARLPGPVRLGTRDWIATVSSWGVVMLTGKHIAAVTIALSILVIAGWGGMKILERPGAGRPDGAGGGDPLIARSEPSPAPAAPAGGQPAPAPPVAAAADTTPAESPAPAEEKPTTLKGRVIGFEGQPLPNCHVSLSMEGPGNFKRLEADADEEGAFEFEDVQAGIYHASASDPRHDPGYQKIDFPDEAEVTLRLAPAAFVPLRIFICDSSAPLRNGQIEVCEGSLDGTSYHEPSRYKTDGEGRAFIGPYVHDGDLGEHLFTIQSGKFKAVTMKISIVRDAATRTEKEVVLTQGISVKGTLSNLQGAPIPGVDINWRKPGANMSTQLKCTTDAEGRFERTGLEPGSYIAAVRAVTLGFTIQRNIELTEEAFQEADLTVDCIPVLEVRVEDQEGNPLAGIKVRYTYRVRGGSGDTSSEPTDADGWTSIRCIETGFPLELQLESWKSPGSARASYMATPDETSIVLRLDPEIKLLGEVVDEDGNPVSKAAITLVERHPVFNATLHRNAAKSDPEGRFEMILPPGNYRVAANGGKRGAATEDLSIENGTSPNRLQLKIGTEKCIRVHVAGPDGNPLADIGLQCSLEKTKKWEGQEGRSDKDGWVSFPTGPGTYAITMTECPGGLYLTEALTGIRGGGPPIEIQLSKLDRSVSGVVLHDGRPVPKAKVGYWRVNGGWSGNLEYSTCTTDGDGKFQLKQVADREIRVIAWGPGFAMAMSELLHLPEGGKVEGINVISLVGKDYQARFLDPDGKPFPNLRVKICAKPESDAFTTMGITDQEGILYLPGLPPGDYNLRGETPDRALSLREDFSWDGQAIPSEFQLKKNRPPP